MLFSRVIFNPAKHDFTLVSYRKLLTALCESDFNIMTLEAFVQGTGEFGKVAILRHDVDTRPQNALAFARLQSEMGVKGTYYFRIVKQSFDSDIIKEIAGLGHEIGYHYEDFTLARGDHVKAFSLFEKNLALFRDHYPIKTICMHGSPLSNWDNRDLWRQFNYKQFGIIAEPYFDIDFSETRYLTDTGRRWNGAAMSVRDKVVGRAESDFKNTSEIIKAIRQGTLPDKLMINIHPQRWTDNPGQWLGEFVFQNIKNIIKRIIVRKRKRDEYKIQDRDKFSYA